MTDFYDYCYSFYCCSLATILDNIVIRNSHSLPCEMNPALCNRVSSSNIAPTNPLAETKRRMISNKLLLSYRQSITVI